MLLNKTKIRLETRISHSYLRFKCRALLLQIFTHWSTLCRRIRRLRPGGGIFNIQIIFNSEPKTNKTQFFLMILRVGNGYGLQAFIYGLSICVGLLTQKRLLRLGMSLEIYLLSVQLCQLFLFLYLSCLNKLIIICWTINLKAVTRVAWRILRLGIYSGYK